MADPNEGDWYTYGHLGYESANLNNQGNNIYLSSNQVSETDQQQPSNVQYTGEDAETEAEFVITNCVEDGGDGVGVDSDLSKHNLVLKEVITEQGLIRESYFCQDCFVEYSDVNEFLQQHPGVELLESPEIYSKQEDLGTEDIFEETIEEDNEVHIKEEGTQHDKLWELVENIIEEDHTDDPQLSELISLNKTAKQELESATPPIQTKSEVVDADSEHYFCYECQQIFSSLKSAEEHDCGTPPQSETAKEQSDEMLEHQNADLFEAETPEQACVYCGQISSSYEDLKKHMIYCEQNATVPLTTTPASFHCDLCNKDYPNMRSFNNHVRLHKRIKNDTPQGPIKCEICNTIFQSSKNLKLHMKMHNERSLKTIQEALPAGALTEYSELNQFFCEICNKSFDQRLLAIHKNMHQNIEEYNCSKCNKQFDNSTNYEMHMQMHNETKGNSSSSSKHIVTSPELALLAKTCSDGSRKQYACQYCGKEFLRPYEKVKHERIHTGEKPYNCEVCGKTFRVSYSLTLHLRTHTDIRPYVCATCNKRFKQQSVYVHHLKTHVSERQYRCEECGKSFRTSVQLCGHRNSHKKPFNCTECNRPFASMYAVKVHMKTHNKDSKANKNLKNRCDLCGATYARIFALRFHLKEQHGVDVDPAQLLDAEHSSVNGKELDVETAILMNAANEAQLGDEHNGEMNFMNDDDDDVEDIEFNNANNSIDETVAATQTIMSKDQIVVDNFHDEEIITDWLK